MLLPRPPAPGTEPRFSTGEVVSSRISPDNAESLAASFLQQGVTEADVCALVPYLKSERPARGQGMPSEFSFTTGAYVHGSLVGLRTHASTFPNVTRCLCDLVKRRAPEIEFSSIALFKDLCTPPHRDLNNSSGFPSCLVPCSSFEGGELWIEDEEGSVACPDPAVATKGRLLSLTGPTLFDPHLLHATAPWVGSRVVIAAFVIARFELLTASDRSALQSLGFRCPALSTGDKAGPAPPRPLRSNFPVVFEIFSGSARITTALRSFWPHCFGVDSRPSSEARSHTLVADLSSPAGQDLLWHWLRCPYLVGLWIAPPCGTASLARCIPVYDAAGNVVPSPPPLRDSAHPDGLPGLEGLHAVRVCQANILYSLVQELCAFADQAQIMVAVENPRGSLFWSTSSWRRAQPYCPFWTCFQNCAFKGRRPKWTAIAHNHPSFTALARTCPGASCASQHLPWGLTPSHTWSTSEECAYPPFLAVCVARCFARAVEVAPPSEPSIAAIRARAGLQPKASSYAPLVPEHKQVVVLRGPSVLLDELPVEPMARLKKEWAPPPSVAPAGALPTGSQLLRSTPLTVNMGLPDTDQVPTGAALQPEVPPQGTTEVAWGIPFEPQEFVRAAVAKGHPRTFSALLPSVLEEAIDFNASHTLAETAEVRTGWFKHWLNRMGALKEEEAALKASMPPERAKVLEGKNLLLWQEMLRASGYPDLGVVDLMKEGVDLAGQVPASGLFGPCFKPAKLSPAGLAQQTPEVRRKILVAASKPSEHDAVICQKTAEEYEKGWVSGPLDPSSLPSDAVINRRFAILQKDRPRVIDDCSASLLNDTVQKTESPQPQSVDLIAAMVLAALQRLPGKAMVGKCLDLKAAYRQVPVSAAGLMFAFVAYFCPAEAKCVVRQMYALPFGASRAVYGYLRIAYSLWWLAVKNLKLMMTHFFDDFVNICRSEEQVHVERVLHGFFALLGWKVSEDKDHGFQEEFTALGIWVSFSRFLHSEVLFFNTPSRIQEVSAYLNSLLEVRTSTKKELERIRGRMLFAGGQLFGRLGRTCVKALQQAEADPQCVITDAMASAITLFIDLLRNGPPRMISNLSAQPCYIFTDAAFDRAGGSSRCGLGGVLIGPDGMPRRFFSVELHESFQRALGVDESSTIIFEAELCAVVLAYVLWRDDICSRPIVCYIDNNATRDVLISGSARNQVGARLARLLLTVETLAKTFSWFARVPSPSNLADEPSRTLMSTFQFEGVVLEADSCQQTLEMILA